MFCHFTYSFPYFSELVPSHNLAMRRDLGQSVARAAMKLGRYEQALTMAKQLVSYTNLAAAVLLRFF